MGRQGDFEHGIDIVNAADYFSLGTRSHAYRDVAVYIAQFEKYRMPLIDELLNSKVPHWVRGFLYLMVSSVQNGNNASSIEVLGLFVDEAFTI